MLLIDESKTTFRWCQHRTKPEVRYLVHCHQSDGAPVAFAMDDDEGLAITAYRLVTPAPKECVPHMRAEFGLIDFRTFNRLYELELLGTD